MTTARPNLHENIPDGSRCIAITGPRSKTPGERCRNWRAKGSEYCGFHLYIPQRAARKDQDPVTRLSTIPEDAPSREEERARVIQEAVEREERRVALAVERELPKSFDTDAEVEFRARELNMNVHPHDLPKVQAIEAVLDDAFASSSLKVHLRVVLDQLRRGERLLTQHVPGSTQRASGAYPGSRMVEADRTDLHNSTEGRQSRRVKQPTFERTPAGGVIFTGYK